MEKRFHDRSTYALFDIPKRLNFLQMGRYSTYGEQRFRQQFEKKFDFMPFNTELTAKFFGTRKAIAFDPSYISKPGKKTPRKSLINYHCRFQIEFCNRANPLPSQKPEQVRFPFQCFAHSREYCQGSALELPWNQGKAIFYSILKRYATTSSCWSDLLCCSG